MGEGIRGGGPTRPPVTTPVERTPAKETTKGGVPPSEAAAAAAADGPQALDVFENSGLLRGQRKLELGSVAARSLGEVPFSDQELARLASTLVGLVKKQPKASRASRAKAFTRAILRGGGRLAKVLERMDEAEAERMFDDIATILADSPRLAEWIDSVSEEASRFNG